MNVGDGGVLVGVDGLFWATHGGTINFRFVRMFCCFVCKSCFVCMFFFDCMLCFVCLVFVVGSAVAFLFVGIMEVICRIVFLFFSCRFIVCYFKF